MTTWIGSFLYKRPTTHCPSLLAPVHKISELHWYINGLELHSVLIQTADSRVGLQIIHWHCDSVVLKIELRLSCWGFRIQKASKYIKMKDSSQDMIIAAFIQIFDFSHEWCLFLYIPAAGVSQFLLPGKEFGLQMWNTHCAIVQKWTKTLNQEQLCSYI